MLRAVLLAAVLPFLGGPKPAPGIDYILGADAQASGAPGVSVEIRLRGDPDGETLLDLPDSFAGAERAWRRVSDFTVKGAKVSTPDPAHRLLRHKPNARLVIRYRVQTAYDRPPQSGGNPYAGPLIQPDWFALLGEYVFATPQGRGAEPVTFGWGKLPPGWRGVSDLDHGRAGKPLTLADVSESISMAGARLAVAERPIAGGTLRVASLADGPYKSDALADSVAGAIAAERAFWNDQREPYLVVLVPLVAARPGAVSVGGTGRGDGFVLYATPGQDDIVRWTIAHEHTHTWIPNRVGALPKAEEARVYWFSEGFTDFFANRLMLRAGQATGPEVVYRLDQMLQAYDHSAVRTAPVARIVADFWKDPAVEKLPYQRGQLLALKWDEAVRRKSGGKLDLDDVILHMRDHYQRFRPGEGPDVVTGIVSAMWVVAGIDIRPDIARYADAGAVIDLPDEMFDGCLQARVTVTPAFDAGFDADASFAAKTVKGVRRRGPGWNSGLRDGMALDAWTYKAGDMTRQIELTLRPLGKRAKPKKITFWPYGDATAETRKLQLTPGMTEAQRTACARKIGGL